MRLRLGYDPNVARFEENGKTVTMVSLLIPMLLESIFLLMYGTVNTLMLSGYSQTAVSAISVSNQVKGVATVILSMVTNGATIITSVALGSKNYERVKNVSGTGAFLTTFLSVLLGIVLSCGAGFFLKLMRLKGEAYNLAVSHLAVCGMFLPATALLSFTNKMLITNGYPRCTMVVGVAGNVMNIALSYAALYSGVFLPFSGVTAVALASGISQTICFFAAILLFWKKRCPFRLKLEKMHIYDIFRLGVPSGMAGFSWTLSQTVTTSFVIPLGYIAINTKVYVTNIINYISQTSFAFGNANRILMGRHRGAGNIANVKKLFRQNMSKIIFSNLVLSLSCFIFRDILVGLFTDDGAILATATSIMLVDIVLEIGRGFNHIAEGSLSANGDVRTILIISVVSCWLCSVFFGYLLCVKAGLGLTGLWIGFAADEFFKVLFYLLRWRSGKWQKMKI